MHNSYIPLNPELQEGVDSFSNFDTSEVGAQSINQILNHSAYAKDVASLSCAQISVNYVEGKVWGDLFTTPLEFKGSAEVVCFVIDVMVYDSKVKLIQTEDMNYVQRMGSGFRLGVAAGDAKVKLTADIQQIAALVELNQTTVFMESKIFGIKTHKMDFQKFPLFNLTSNDFTSIHKHIGITAANLTDFIVEHPEELVPQPVGQSILGGPSYSTFNMVWSHHFGLEGITNGRSLKKQLEHIHYWHPKVYQQNLLIPIVASVYQEFGCKDPDATPSWESKDIAYHILQKGK